VAYLLKHRDRLLRGIHQLLGLAQIEQRGDAAGLPVDREVQGVLAGGERGLRNFQFVVQFTQMEIIGAFKSKKAKRVQGNAPEFNLSSNCSESAELT
jgi:hypothetical protein